MATSDTPIIGYMPGGGVASGGPPPLFPGEVTDAEGGITPLINGQSYVDVMFVTAKSSANWEFADLMVVNTNDVSPLNIWPGILTIKTTTGFRLQLNGKPDSDNYYLHWTVSGSGTADWILVGGGGGGGIGTITGGPLVAGNITAADAPANIVDSGLAITDVALESDIPTDLSDLTVGDASIPRKKTTYLSVSNVSAVLSGSTYTFVPGSIYFGDIGSNCTFAFGPAAIAESDPPTRLFVRFTAPITLTVPTLVRNADNGAVTSVSVLAVQYAVIEFSKTGAGNIRMLDNILPSESFGTVTATFDGAGTTLTATNTTVPYTVPYNAAIIGWNISVDGGTATFKVWKKAAGSAIPTVADSINGSSPPAISSGTHLRSSTLTDFTTLAVTAGDQFIVQLITPVGVTKCVFELEMRKA